MFMIKGDACFLQLKEIVDQETLEECNNLIKKVIECIHVRVLGRQKSKYEALHQQKISGHSNKVDCTSNPYSHTCTDPYMHRSENTEVTKKWVKNLSSTPLTKEQERLLPWGPKFAIKLRQPPVGEYIAAVEQACSKLGQGEANDLKVEVKKALTKTQNTPRVLSNITREENKALKELKMDKSRIILTTDKGVALVMDKADYNKKAEELLNTTTYKKIPEDPSSRQKSKLISILKTSRLKGDQVKLTKECTPQE